MPSAIALDSGFDAFSSREPASTPDQVWGRLSLENALFDKRRELRALIRHEHRNQFRRFGIAGIGRDQMHRARRLEERLPDLEGLDHTAGELRADFALGDIGGDRA